MDTWEWHQIGLELRQIDVENAVEAHTRGNGANHLGDQAIQVFKARTGDIQVTTTDIIDSLIVNKESAVGVLDGAVGGQHSVVWFHHGGRYAGRWVDREFQFGLLAILLR